MEAKKRKRKRNCRMAVYVCSLCVCGGDYVFVCEWDRKREKRKVCVCVCVCEREREIERERERNKERQKWKKEVGEKENGNKVSAKNKKWEKEMVECLWIILCIGACVCLYVRKKEIERGEERGGDGNCKNELEREIEWGRGGERGKIESVKKVIDRLKDR